MTGAPSLTLYSRACFTLGNVHTTHARQHTNVYPNEVGDPTDFPKRILETGTRGAHWEALRARVRMTWEIWDPNKFPKEPKAMGPDIPGDPLQP